MISILDSKKGNITKGPWLWRRNFYNLILCVMLSLLGRGKKSSLCVCVCVFLFIYSGGDFDMTTHKPVGTRFPVGTKIEVPTGRAPPGALEQCLDTPHSVFQEVLMRTLFKTKICVCVYQCAPNGHTEYCSPHDGNCFGSVHRCLLTHIEPTNGQLWYYSFRQYFNFIFFKSKIDINYSINLFKNKKILQSVGGFKLIDTKYWL